MRMRMIMMTKTVMTNVSIKVVWKIMKLVVAWEMSMLANQTLSSYKLYFVLVTYLDI